MKVWISRQLANRFLRRIAVGSLVVVEGSHRRYGNGNPTATLRIRSPRAWPMLLSGSRGLAAAYEQGLWDSPDLVALIRLASLNMPGVDRVRGRLTPVLKPVRRLSGCWQRSTRASRRRDIAAHYDLGNELFKLMLDPTLSYSCAVFEHANATLEEAQVAKLERVCAKLALDRGDRVIEIGTGWGSFALYAARTRGCHVTTTTISREQHEFVTAQVRAAGVGDRVKVLQEDYRDLSGTYDKLVSLEMIEAVGWRHLGAFFTKCSSLLCPEGAMLLQAITIDDRAYEVEKASRSFVKTRIFPGGSLPSLEVITRSLARRTDLETVDLEDITPHYVETLHRWRRNFLAAADHLEALGYDAAFRRLWSLYLAYCEGGFAERRIRDVQMLLAKPRWEAGAGRSGRRRRLAMAGPPPGVAAG